MNTAIMMGRLTKDPEIRYAQADNSAIAFFSIAVDRKFKREGSPDADFFNCSAFGKTAEIFEKYIKKGTKVVIQGRLQNDTYTNKEGQKVTATKIMVEQVEFAESKKDSDTPPKDAPSAPSNGFMEVPALDGEIPFI